MSLRELLSGPIGEFVGTMILVIFGAGVNCQATLSSNPLGSASPKGVCLTTTLASSAVSFVHGRITSPYASAGRQACKFSFPPDRRADTLRASGIALGVWVSGGISGGHINPAVTLALAVFRDFPWRKVPAYMFAQLMGGLCGAGIVYANYIHAIDLYEGGRHIRTVPGTASLFSTYAVRPRS